MNCVITDCYAPINMSKVYRVVSDSYFITTSNRVIATKGRNRLRGSAIYDVLVEYLKAKYPINKDVSVAAKLRHTFLVYILLIFVTVFLEFDGEIYNII